VLSLTKMAGDVGEIFAQQMRCGRRPQQRRAVKVGPIFYPVARGQLAPQKSGISSGVQEVRPGDRPIEPLVNAFGACLQMAAQ